MMEGFSPASPPRIFWNSRKRSATARSLEDAAVRAVARAKEPGETAKAHPAAADEHRPEEEEKVGKAALSERRQALFEPLEPSSYGRRTPADVLLPPPDFDPTCYPKGWLVGKKRKLVNVDVVESMRRIAIQEMNRKDKEIDGLNEQLEEDARCLEHLQVQLLEERSKRVEAERQNAMLQDQVSMLMNVLEETQAVEEEASGDH
ncbi:protein HEADING DATE REPRESSOR 1 isoform X2 [Musa acuminata AAA Group]|uniref:protein HEADING DATE REPRESSOR 1 isoform X2 n=1 Tax=Musa acuminata AAA Group TaxID=214697 RepID=UPI0031D060CE